MCLKFFAFTVTTKEIREKFEALETQVLKMMTQKQVEVSVFREFLANFFQEDALKHKAFFKRMELALQEVSSLEDIWIWPHLVGGHRVSQ